MKNLNRYGFVLLVGLLALSFGAGVKQAQAQASEQQAGAAVQLPAEFYRPFTGSLLFTPLELSSIKTALEGYVPYAEEGAEEVDEAMALARLQPRLVRLSGIIYRAPNDWIVWINGQRLSPGKLIPEVAEIQVKRDHVIVKWYDAPTREVISIRLRPHQTYDILTGVLLPG